MALSNKLVSKFVKATKADAKNKQKEKIVYGRIMRIDKVGTPDAVYYAAIDGSSFTEGQPSDDYTGLIPITNFTENVDVEKKLIITIKDHNAIVTGSIDVNEVPVSVAKQIEEKIQNIEVQSIPIDEINNLWK